MQAGFVRYPGGTPAGPVQTIGSTGTAFYDLAVNRWLPVPSEAVSPDGLRFAYADYDLPSPAAGMASHGGPRSAGVLATTGRVYVVDARTGASQVLYSGSPTYAVVGFEKEGIYLAQVSITMDGNFHSGLYLLPLGMGGPSEIAAGSRGLDRTGWRIENGAAWGVEFSTGGGITGGNELVRLNLQTGDVTVWLTKPSDTQVGLLGFDAAGDALVGATGNGYSTDGSPPPSPPTQLLALTSPSNSNVVYQSTDASATVPWGPSFVDGNGVWLSGESGSVWLDQGDTLSILPISIPAVLSVGNGCMTGG